MANHIVFPLPGKKVADDYQKYAGAGNRSTQANPLKAPAQANAEKLTHRDPNQHRRQNAVNQGKKRMAAAD
jgi:hypothetical protein